MHFATRQLLQLEINNKEVAIVFKVCKQWGVIADGKQQIQRVCMWWKR